MQIEAYIKDLLFDFDQVVIPGFGAFIGTEQFAQINETEQKIYPPSKQISFDDQLQLDDGVLISKIEEEERLSKEAAIEAVQHFVEQLSTLLENHQVHTIEGLGTLRKTHSDHIAFQQDKSVNYFVDAYGLDPINLPERITIPPKEDLVENNITHTKIATIAGEDLETNHIEVKTEIEKLNSEAVDEKEPIQGNNEEEIDDQINSQPHADEEIVNADDIATSFESIENDRIDVEEAQYQSAAYQKNSILEKEYEPLEGEEKIASGFDEYVEAEDNYQIEAENVKVTESNHESQKRFSLWLLLLPLMLLIGAGYLLFSLMGKTENPYAKEMPKATKPSTEKVDKPLVEKKEKDLSVNSTAALLQTKAEKAKKKIPEKKPEATKPPIKENTLNTTSSANSLNKGYYIIISSTKSKQEANNEALKWTKRNYPAFVLPGPNGYNRIGIYAGAEKTTAEQKLENYKNDINTAAWILKY